MESIKNVANESFDWNAFENDLDIYGGQSKEQVSEAYDQTLSNIAVGEVVEGTVSEINKREVTVNIGYKSEGIISTFFGSSFEWHFHWIENCRVAAFFFNLFP